jgi:methionine aminotransferase
MNENNSLSSKLPDVGTTIFAVMSKMAVENNAINLSQGFPDFPLDSKLVNLVSKAMQEGHNQYAPMPGLPALRQVIAQVIQNTYQKSVDADTEITITAGGTQALFSILQALVHKGDEVIVFDPAYDSYNPAIRLSGGVPVHISLKAPSFSIDWQEVETKINSRTKIIMVNTPHNPSGAVFSEKDIQELERIVLKHNLIVLSDEVYERIIFDDKKHYSVLARPALANNSMAVFSFGKTFHATGWKTGYVVAPAALTKEIRKAHQFIVFSVNTPIQVALAEYMKTPEHYNSLGKFYQQKRDQFLSFIKGSSLQPLNCYGSYFQLLSYEGISKQGDMAMAEELIIKHKVASIPVSVFYQDKRDDKLLRFCFAKQDETLEKAGEILRKI